MKDRYKKHSVISLIILFAYWVVLFALNIAFSFRCDEWITLFSIGKLIGTILIAVVIINNCFVIKHSLTHLNKENRNKYILKTAILRCVPMLFCVVICFGLFAYNKCLNLNVYETINNTNYEYRDDELTVFISNESSNIGPKLTIVNNTDNVTNEYNIISYGGDKYDVKYFILDNIDSDKPDIALQARRYLGNSIEIRFVGIKNEELGFLNLRSFILNGKTGDGSMS